MRPFVVSKVNPGSVVFCSLDCSLMSSVQSLDTKNHKDDDCTVLINNDLVGIPVHDQKKFLEKELR
jgi:hypothetical protein